MKNLTKYEQESIQNMATDHTPCIGKGTRESSPHLVGSTRPPFA